MRVTAWPAGAPLKGSRLSRRKRNAQLGLWPTVTEILSTQACQAFGHEVLVLWAVAGGIALEGAACCLEGGAPVVHAPGRLSLQRS